MATSVRIPSDWYSFIENLAEDHLGISKHETLLKLIEAGLEIAKTELGLNEIDETIGNFHLLNTNKSFSVDEHTRMIKEGIATSLYTPWKFNICKIKKFDLVFLFENKVGIVAFGKATGEIIKEDYCGAKDERYLQKLEDFTILKKPLRASEIKRILGRKIVFMRTRTTLPDGEKLRNEILKKL